MPYNARFLYQQPKTEINNYLIVNWFSLPLQTMEKHLVSFVETQENGDMVNIGRNPASTSGSVFNVNFVYALKEDNSKFVEFIVKATLE